MSCNFDDKVPFESPNTRLQKNALAFNMKLNDDLLC